MAKNNKAPKKAPAAPAASENNNTQQQAAQQQEGLVEVVSVASQFGKMAGSLDANHQVELLGILNDRFFKDPEAAKHTGFPEEQIHVINEITACGAVTILAAEVVHGNSEFALRMRPSQLEHITKVCDVMGINIVQAALPAPDAEGNVLLPAAAVEVSEETEKQIKDDENAANAETVTDPTKISSEEELIQALHHIMVTRQNLYLKINDSINFYSAYLKFTASKAENKEEALAKVNEKSRIDLLKEMAKLIGACPLMLSGVGKYMYNVTTTTKSPISAFCMFRNTVKNKKTGAIVLTDPEIADYVRTLIEWTTDIKIEDQKKKIADAEANLAVLKKDEKKNAKAIEEVTAKIETFKGNIAHFSDALEYISNPSGEVPANLISQYEAKDSTALRMYKAITDSFYDDIELREMKLAGVKHNVGMYAGIITNLFRAPGAQLEGYHASDIVALEPIEAPAEEAPAAAEEEGGESKKA